MTTSYGRLQPLLVGIAVRQGLTPTAQAQAALARAAGGVTPTWAGALSALPPRGRAGVPTGTGSDLP